MKCRALPKDDRRQGRGFELFKATRSVVVCVTAEEGSMKSGPEHINLRGPRHTDPWGLKTQRIDHTICMISNTGETYRSGIKLQ